MRTPSSQKCRLDLAPPLADRFISGFPIDYGPVLLRRPFGFHLAMDTLPSGVQTCGGFRSALGCVQLSPSCPFRPLHTFRFLRPARLRTPLLRYGAPHLSARGTSTLLNNALLSTHFLLLTFPQRRPAETRGDSGLVEFALDHVLRASV